MIYLFTELFQILDEVGNPEIPKAVFFFDEAHLLFDDISKVLLEKLTKVVKLIRSKGVGIFFISQNPLDIDQAVSSQLSTKIIHQLRAFSPKELKNLKEISLSLRENKDFNTMDTLTSLGTGVAIISSLDENGIPKPVEEVIIRPLHSSFDVLTEGEIDSLVENSNLYRKYQETIDRTSAYEILQEKLLKKEDEEKKLKAKSEEEKNRQIEMRYINKGIDSMLGTITRTIGREIARGILGSLRKK